MVFFLLAWALLKSLKNPTPTELMCVDSGSGILEHQTCFDALRFTEDFNLARARNLNGVDSKIINYLEIKNPKPTFGTLTTRDVRILNRRSCTLESLSDGSFRVQNLLTNTQPCFSIEVPEKFSIRTNPWDLVKIDIAMSKLESAIQPVLFRREYNTVESEASSGWNSFSHEFSLTPQKGDIVLLDGKYEFTVGEDQPEKLHLTPARSIFHGVGGWPGGLGRKIDIIRKVLKDQTHTISEGAILEIKRYETETQTFLSISFVHNNSSDFFRWGLLFEGMTSSEILINQINVSLSPRHVIDKRLIVLSPETYNNVTSSSAPIGVLNYFKQFGSSFYNNSRESASALD